MLGFGGPDYDLAPLQELDRLARRLPRAQPGGSGGVGRAPVAAPCRTRRTKHRRALVRRPLHAGRPGRCRRPRRPGLRGPRTGRYGGDPRARDFRDWLRWYTSAFREREWAVHDLISEERQDRRPLLGVGDVQGRPARHTFRRPAHPRDRHPDPPRRGRACARVWSEMSDLQVVMQLGAPSWDGAGRRIQPLAPGGAVQSQRRSGPVREARPRPMPGRNALRACRRGLPRRRSPAAAPPPRISRAKDGGRGREGHGADHQGARGGERRQHEERRRAEGGEAATKRPAGGIGRPTNRSGLPTSGKRASLSAPHTKKARQPASPATGQTCRTADVGGEGWRGAEGDDVRQRVQVLAELGEPLFPLAPIAGDGAVQKVEDRSRQDEGRRI